jgi:hypothetical protein
MSLVGCQVKNKGLKLTMARVTTYHVVSPQQASDLKVLLIIHVQYLHAGDKQTRAGCINKVSLSCVKYQ